MEWINGSLSTVLLGALVAFLLILIFYVLWLNYKMNRLSRKYQQYMQGEDGQTLERKLAVEVRELREMTAAISSMVAEQEQLGALQNNALQKVGMVHYNAFTDGSQDDSFSLTLLDGKGNGVTLTTLSSREESRVYAKMVRNQQYIGRASREEEKSLEMALHHEK